MANSFITSGSFTADGNRKLIPVPYGVDKFTVTNNTILISGAANAFYFEWTPAMGQGLGYKITNSGAPVYAGLSAGNGFYFLDPNQPIVFTPATNVAGVATTAISAATSPVVSTGNTTGLSVGSIVRLYETAVPAAQSSMNGIDWQVSSVVTNTSFTMEAVLPNGPTVSAGAGFYRIVTNLPPWRKYFVANVTQAATATVTFTTDHFFTAQTLDANGNVTFSGDFVTFLVEDPLNGMTQLNNVGGYVLSIPAPNQIVVGINTTAFTAFSWPSQAAIAAQGNYTPASASVSNADIDLLYMVLPGGANNPAGATGNLMIWEASKYANT